MRSRVIHPNIPADDYYNIEVGAREGSVLSPILLLVAIEDMQEYLAAHPFQQRATVSTKHAKRQRQKGKPPGVRIGGTYLAFSTLTTRCSWPTHLLRQLAVEGPR